VLTAICTLAQVMVNAPGTVVGIMLAYLCLTVLISVKQIRSQNGIREDIIRQKNALDGQICQSISNLELIRGMNAEGYEKRRLHPAISQIAAGRMAPGAVITVCLLFQQLVKPIDEVYRFIDETASSVVKAKVLVDLTDVDEDPVFSIPHAPQAVDNRGIVLHNVCQRQ